MGYEQILKEAQESHSQTVEQNLKGTQNSQEETKPGKTLLTDKDYELGVDFSDIPEQIRTQVKEKFKQKGKLLEDGYQSKFREVAKFKQAQEELVQLGLSVNEAKDVLIQHINAKKNPIKSTEQKKDAVKILDSLVNDAPSEQKEALRQMRSIILEETNSDELKKEVHELKGLVKMLSGKADNERIGQVQTELVNLSKVYGDELVDKYKDTILEIASKFPNESVRKIFFHEAADELEQTILSKKEDSKTILTKEKKEAISSNSSGISGAADMLDTKKESFSSLLQKISKLK